MKKKKSRSISNVKRSNQKRNKLVKKGKLKPNSKPTYTPNLRTSTSKQKHKDDSRNEELERERRREALEDEARDQLIGEMDPEDVNYLLNNAEEIDLYERRALERIQKAAESEKKVKTLLPIKTKAGIKTQVRVIEENMEEEEEEEEEDEEEEEEESNDKEETQRDQIPQEVSVIELMAKRKTLLAEYRVEIGSLASNFLENPEERLQILERLVKKVDGEDVDPTIAVTAFKLVSLSVLEIFKDVIPSYKIITLDSQDSKLKKETLRLQRYERGLLACVKAYLVKLEKKLKTSSLKPHALDCMGKLLVAHPHFNYANNIVNVLSAYCNSPNVELRRSVYTTFKELFRNDKRGEISLYVVRRLNRIAKSASKVHSEVVDVLIYLPIVDINGDKFKDDEIERNKRIKRNQKMIMTMSKKEKKRKKKLEHLEKELLEAKGEESAKTKVKFYTEISKLVFAIYFRILKASKSSLLIPVLKGLAKFSHAINIDFFQDLLSVFSNLLLKDENSVTLSGHLHIIRTVFVVLSGQGEFLNIDPVRFYNVLYSKLLYLETSDQCLLAIQALTDMIIKRKKKISNSRTMAFAKRLMTAALTTDDELSALSYLGLLREIFVAHPEVFKVLMETDDEYGSGVFMPEVSEPENSNAARSVLWELHSLRDHYNPKIQCLTNHFLGIGSLSRELRMGPVQLAQEMKTEFLMDTIKSKPSFKSKKRKIRDNDGSVKFSRPRLERWRTVLNESPDNIC